MVIVRIEHAVPSFDKWKQAFDNDPVDRKGSGVRRYQIFRLQDDPNFVMIDLEFERQDEATGFLQKMQRVWDGPGKAVMQGPRARVVELVETRQP
jgi:hypothetical protein